MTQNNDPFIENIPAYVLGALSRTETAALKAHLETCRVCQAELAQFQQIGDGLLGAILPLQTAPAVVKGKLLERLEAKTAIKWRASGWGFRQLAFGVLTLLLISTNLIAFQQIRSLRQQQTQLVSQIEKNHTIVGMLAADTEMHPIDGEGFSGNLLLDREKNLSYLVVWNLPLPPEDSIYQIWLVSPEGDRIDAGSFRPETERPFTSAALLSSRNFTEFVGVEVTIEPLGGSDSPTGEKIMGVDY